MIGRGVAIAMFLALAGCATTTASSPGATPTAFDLDGEWQIVSLDARPLIGTMRLDRGQYGVSFGCNRLAGSASVVGARLVPSGPLAQTEMACTNALDRGPDPMAVEDKGFQIATQPMWIASTRTPRRLRFWNEAGSFEADWIGPIPQR